jgi:hypothetical protein
MLSMRHGNAHFRSTAFAMLVLLLCSTRSTAECRQPALPNPESVARLTYEAEVAVRNAFQSSVYEFIACRRSSLEKRAAGLTPSAVRDLILGDREAEDRALAELQSDYSCLSRRLAKSGSTAAREACERSIKSALNDRREDERGPEYREGASEHRAAYGGTWSYRTLDLGRPGNCMDAPCDHMFGVEVTNMTPIRLTCEVMLKVSTSDPERTGHGEQMITLNPGDSLPAARVTTMLSAEHIEPAVTCAPATPLPPPPPVPSGCTVNWVNREFEFPRGFVSSAWVSGTALVEFATPEKYGPAEAIYITHADSPQVGQSAEALINKLRLHTNCARQRFRVRVDYRAFPCYGCTLERGVVTLYRDDSI